MQLSLLDLPGWGYMLVTPVGWALLDDFLRYGVDRVPPARRFGNYEAHGLA